MQNARCRPFVTLWYQQVCSPVVATPASTFIKKTHRSVGFFRQMAANQKRIYIRWIVLQHRIHTWDFHGGA